MLSSIACWLFLWPRTVHAEDCEARRPALQAQITSALKLGQTEQCRQLRKTLAATDDCRAELDGLRAEIEGRLEVRCRCPDDASTLLERCRSLANAAVPCTDERERSLLQCLHEIDGMDQCPQSSGRDEVRASVVPRYGTCAVCQDVAGAARAAAVDLSTCDAVSQARKRRTALLACPGANEEDLNPLLRKVNAAHKRLQCSDKRLTSRLYREIEELNRRIREASPCATPECRELERRRLFALSTYLELVRVRAQEDVERARALLRGVGVDPALVQIIEKHGSEVVQLVGQIFDFQKNPELRDRFIRQLRQAQLEDLAKALEQGDGDIQSFVEQFLKVPREQQKRVLWTAQDLHDSNQAFAEAVQDHRPLAAWEVWTELASDTCEQCGRFVDEFHHYIGHSTLTHGASEQEFVRHRRERQEQCARANLEGSGSKAPPDPNPCGVLLRLRLSSDPDELHAAGEIYYVDGRTAFEDMAYRELPPLGFARGAERAAARSLARSALMSISTVVPAEALAEPLGSAAPAAQCGVRVTYNPAFRRAPLHENLVIQGDCGSPALAKSLRQSLQGAPLIGTVGDTAGADGTPRLILNAGDAADGLTSCVGELRSADGTFFYAIKANIDQDKPCEGRSAEQKAEDAGRELGRLIRNYYAMSPALSTDAAGSGAYALLFAGLPYLQDPRATLAGKITASALDATLVLATTVSFGFAVKYRNEAATEAHSSMDAATAALNAGIVFASSLAAVRICTSIVYAIQKHRRKVHARSQ